ncbi:VPEID-CTERM sorting domain-containing protein [Methylobacter svalbardensis]|uniref:VPEID-CTERM sorting domain-containing protein n=1 Tax=Methylobacter svalbardensis TaxID=3080016 RepID=UPI0030EF63C7
MIILKILKLLSMGLTGVVLAGGIAWAVNSGINRGDKLGLSSPPTLTRGVAPEIDAASGTSAIALLTGVLLLAGEKSRSRRS